MAFGSVDALRSEASSLIRSLASKKLDVRATGGAAVALLIPDVGDLWARAGRPMPRDMDLLARSHDRLKIARSLKELGWIADEQRNAIHGRIRHIYSRDDGVGLDVFFDALRMCHEVPMTVVKGDTSQTVPVGDLLLHKLQIVELNTKDVIDLTALLDAVARGDVKLSVEDMQARTDRDWGLWLTVTTNLQRLVDAQDAMSWLAAAQADAVVAQARGLIASLSESDKSVRWRARALVGTRVQWFEDVEEVNR